MVEVEASPVALAQKLVREPLEVSEPPPAPSRQPRSASPRATFAVFCALTLALLGSALRVRVLGSPKPREPDWPLVFKGFSETLSALELEQLENDTWQAGSSIMHNTIATEKPSCMEQVDACLDNSTVLFADIDMDTFFRRLDDCLTRAATCAREAEAAEADRALAAANADLFAAVSSLEAGAGDGLRRLTGAIRRASAAVAHEFPAVASFMKTVAERVIAYLQRNLPLWIAAAKQIGGAFGERLVAALRVLQERLPGVANACKCGLGEGAKAVKEASTAAAELLRAELPVWTAEAKKAGMGAIVFAEGLLKDVPKVVDMCKTELEKQIAKDGKKAVVQKALVVGAALGAVGFWMHHQHLETQKAAEEREFFRDWERALPAPGDLTPVLATPRRLRARASESQRLGWPAEHMLASMYRTGLWEAFGRQAALLLERVDNT